MGEKELYARLEAKGVTRRDFMKYCGFLTAVMGLSSSYIPKVAEVFAQPKQRPPVIALHLGECTGCSEAVLSTVDPYIDELLLDIISMEYHETIMAASGHQAEDVLQAAMKKYEGQYIAHIEGAIPTKHPEWGKISDKTFLDLAKEVCGKAAAVIAHGNCATFGGPPAAEPNPGGYKGVGDALGISVVNIPGCPPNPVNLVGTIVNYLLLGKLPALDDLNRPLFAFGKTIHDQCPRRGHYENSEFVEQFGSEEAAKGYCLYLMGCKGPSTYNNCPIAKFNDHTSWPVEAGHPCIGCSEPGHWDVMAPFFEPQ